MPTTQGTSIKGLQLLGLLNLTASRFCNVYVRFQPLDERLVRRGTLLICYRGGPSLLPVNAAYKIYGDGIVLGPDPVWSGVNLEVWANWFQPGLTWLTATPGV